MKKLIGIAIVIIVGLGLLPVISNLVTTNKTSDYSIQYTITSASTVISHDLTNDEFDFILTNYAYITDHTDIELATTVTEEYASIVSTSVPTSLDLVFDTATLTYTASGRAITSDVNLLEDAQIVTIYFDMPVASTMISLLDLVPILIVISLIAGVVIYIKLKKE